MHLDRFCVKCGKETNELIRGLCVQCHLEKNTILDVPSKAMLDYDYRSGRIKVGREWIEKSSENIEGLVKGLVLKAASQKRMNVDGLMVLLEPHDDNINAAVSFGTEVEGVMVKLEKKINLILRKAVSDATTKLSSNYFEATIQARFPENPTQKQQRERLEEILSALKAEKKRNELAEAVAVKKSRKGFDVVVASYKAADKVTRLIAKRNRLKVIYSNSLFGIDDSGRNKYRHTYCLKFSN